MKLVDWHPEDLIDKRHAGTLTEDEQSRLEEHAEACAACRFELLVADDLADEGDDDADEVHRLVLAAVHGDDHERAAPARRGRLIYLWLAAAILVTGSAAALYSSTGSKPVDRARPALQQVVSAVQPIQQAAEAAPAAEAAKDAAADETGGTDDAQPRGSASPSASTAAALFARANAARRAGKRQQALQLYRELQKRHPESSEAKLSRATVGRLMLDAKDPQAALDAFDEYLESGSGSLSEEALVGRAQALRRLGKKGEERAAWQRLLARYPKSIHAARARSRLAELARGK